MTRQPTARGGQRSHSPVIERQTTSKTSDRRSSIKRAALELFAVRGYQATTMSDLGERVGIRGPSIYKYFRSKDEILSEIMLSTMQQLLSNYSIAVASSSLVMQQLQRATEAHVRYHARYRFEAFVGTREIGNLTESTRSRVIFLRDSYEHGFRGLIEKGRHEGVFDVASVRLSSYAILDMGMGVAVWFRGDGPIAEDEVSVSLWESGPSDARLPQEPALTWHGLPADDPTRPRRD